MFMTPTAVSRTRYHTPRHTPLVLRRSTKQVLRRRWNRAAVDGTMDSVHEAIAALVQHAQQVLVAQTDEETERTLDNLISVLPYASRTIQRALSFYGDEERLVSPEFEVTDVIEAAVGQFLPTYSTAVSQAIWNFKPRIIPNSIDEQELTHLEFEYRAWVTPKLITSLILDMHSIIDDKREVEDWQRERQLTVLVS